MRETERQDRNYKLILIPLKKFCSTTTEVASLIERLFNDIKEKSSCRNFELEKKLVKEEERWLTHLSLIKQRMVTG